MGHVVQHSSTWYDATAARGEGWQALTGRSEADCCVVGGGLAGLTLALELAKRGRTVVLLEAGRVCAAASGRNGGFVSNGYALGAAELLKRVGADNARALYELSRQGTEYVRRMIRECDPSVAMGEGLRLCVRYADNGRLASYGEMLQQTFGETVELVRREETRLLLKTDRYYDSLHFPLAFHIHPLRYGLLLARRAAAAHVIIHEGSAARSIERQGSAWRVSCGSGHVLAREVVLCVSSLDRTLHRETGSAVLPVATHVAVTCPLQQSAIMTSSAIADTRRAGDYYRIVDGNRLLWGGRITTRVSEPRSLYSMMRRDIAGVFPELEIPSIDYAWTGQMAYALHKMPLIGKDRAGLWYATGFGGHGLNTTAMAGIMLARAIAEQDDDYRRFALFPTQWAGGALGRCGVQSAYWWMQARDLLDEGLKR